MLRSNPFRCTTFTEGISSAQLTTSPAHSSHRGRSIRADSQQGLASTFPRASRVCFDRIRPETSDVRNRGSTIRERLPRSESFSLFASCSFTNDSKSDVAEAQRRAIVVIAIGNAQERRQVVEPAAAHDWKVGKRTT